MKWNENWDTVVFASIWVKQIHYARTTTTAARAQRMRPMTNEGPPSGCRKPIKRATHNVPPIRWSLRFSSSDLGLRARLSVKNACEKSHTSCQLEHLKRIWLSCISYRASAFRNTFHIKTETETFIGKSLCNRRQLQKKKNNKKNQKKSTNKRRLSLMTTKCWQNKQINNNRWLGERPAPIQRKSEARGQKSRNEAKRC